MENAAHTPADNTSDPSASVSDTESRRASRTATGQLAGGGKLSASELERLLKDCSAELLSIERGLRGADRAMDDLGEASAGTWRGELVLAAAQRRITLGAEARALRELLAELRGMLDAVR